MGFCIFCGKELVNDMCDCAEFRAHYAAEYQGGAAQNDGFQDANYQQGGYDQGYQQGGYDQGYQQQSYDQSYQQQGYQQQGYQQGGYNPNNRQGGYNQGGNPRGNMSGNMYRTDKPYKPFIIPSFSFDFNSFSGFKQSVKDTIGLGEPAKIPGNPFERDVPIIPNCVEPEDNEIVVKQYNIVKLRTRLKFMKAEGRLMVTNKRLLFRAAGTAFNGHTSQEHQFNLDELAGVEIRKDYKFSILNMILCTLLQYLMYTICAFFLGSMITNDGNSFENNYTAMVLICILFGLIGLVPTFVVYKRFWLKVAFSSLAFANNAAAAVLIMLNELGRRDGSKLYVFFIIMAIITGIITLINFLIVCFVDNVVINIKTKGASPAVEIRRTPLSIFNFFFSTAKEDSVGYAEILPWEDTQLAMDELGTLLEDLQRSGDYAIQRWTV